MAEVDAGMITVERWLAAFGAALSSGEPNAVSALFDETCFWRDMAAFTWDICTLEGRPAIEDMIEATPEVAKAREWARIEPAIGDSEQGVIHFETLFGRGRGYVRLRNGKCWILLTVLEALRGFEEPRGQRRPQGFTPDPKHPKANWADALALESQAFEQDLSPYVLIIGAGQGGLGLAARLRQLQTPTLIVDRHARPGDQWRSRYKSLSLHDPVWYDHMPYLPFPDTWPVFTPKDKLADWLEAYAKTMELLIWGSTECVSARYDEAAAEWLVKLDRAGETVWVRPKHLVIATGNAGKPNLPSFPGAEAFTGALLHSSQYTGGEGLAGQKVAVIGSNNSAQDICADLVENGADVTMIQRDSTHVIKSQTFIDLMMSSAYSESALTAGVSTELADLLGASLPLKVLPDVYRPLNAEVARRDADFYARLEATGFMHDFGEDGTGMPLKYLRRASGYYIDVGATELIANGAVKLRSRVSIDRLEAEGVVLSDGSRVAADAIICATGFDSMDQWAAELISPEVARKIGKVWGYGSDTKGDPGPWVGELRNMWKPTPQEGLWFQGGNLAQSRFYSRILALQLKARHVDLPIRIYAPRRQVTATPGITSS